MKAPEKIYIDTNDNLSDSILYGFIEKRKNDDIEYVRKDAFIEKALKWYCLDCECNDNCNADHKCFFRQEYKRYLEGNDNAVPPKFDDAILPDEDAEKNYRYRHYIRKIQDAFIKKACVKLKKLMYDNLMFQGRLHREEVIDNFIEDFKTYMKGE